MMEQNIQTFITWTHGAQPTWLQYHGPSLHDHPPGVQAERLLRVPAPPPPPPQLVLPPPPPPPPPPPEIFHPQFVPSIRTSPTSSFRGQSCPAPTSSERTRQSGRSTDQLSADDLRSLTRTQKRTRTLKGAVSSTAEHYSTTLHRVHSQTVYSCYTVHELRDATITAMPFYIMAGSVFLLV